MKAAEGLGPGGEGLGWGTGYFQFELNIYFTDLVIQQRLTLKKIKMVLLPLWVLHVKCLQNFTHRNYFLFSVLPETDLGSVPT